MWKHYFAFADYLGKRSNFFLGFVSTFCADNAFRAIAESQNITVAAHPLGLVVAVFVMILVNTGILAAAWHAIDKRIK